MLAGAPAAAEIVPVFCSEGAGVGREKGFVCRRADTRATITTVPAGMFFHVTDLHALPNNSATEGSFAASVGRDDASAFPAAPNIDLTGRAENVNPLRFRTPHIVLREGESLALANFATSAFPVDAYVAGYLSPRVTAPEPIAAVAALAALGALGALARRNGLRKARRPLPGECCDDGPDPHDNGPLVRLTRRSSSSFRR